MATEPVTLSRREFLIGTAAAGAGFSLGLYLPLASGPAAAAELPPVKPAGARPALVLTEPGTVPPKRPGAGSRSVWLTVAALVLSLAAVPLVIDFDEAPESHAPTRAAGGPAVSGDRVEGPAAQGRLGAGPKPGEPEAAGDPAAWPAPELASDPAAWPAPERAADPNSAGEPSVADVTERREASAARIRRMLGVYRRTVEAGR